MVYDDTKRLHKDRFASILLGLFFSAAAINQSLLTYIPKVVGLSLLSFLYLVLGVALLAITIFKLIGRCIVYKTHLFCLEIIVVLYLITILYGGHTTLNLLELMLYVIFPILFILKIDIDVKTMVKTSIISPCIAIFNFDSIFALRMYTDNISMGTSYAFLFPIICTFAYIFLYYNKEVILQRCVMVIFIFINAIILCSLFLHGSRGPILCLFVIIMFSCFLKVKDDSGIEVKNKNLFIFLSIVITILLVYIWDIISEINSLLISNGYNINFIRKLFELKNENNILNGRLVEYSFAIVGFIDKPLIGHGMSTFTYYTGYAYPHNFLLQLLYDGGIFTFILFIVPFINGIKKFYKYCKMDDFILGLILFSYSIPSSLFTGDLWKKPVLWGLFSLILSFTNIGKVKRKV